VQSVSASTPADSELVLPPIEVLGTDLLHISGSRRFVCLLSPFVCIAAYLFFASRNLWPPAVLSLVYLSFITYGSISHDLVHRTLGLRRWLNESLLTTIELVTFRSGHAYRLVHLHHHARFPQDDDIEGSAARMSVLRSLVEGIVFQPRLMLWAARRPSRTRPIVLVEIALACLLLATCLGTIHLTPIFAVYAALMIMGSWIIPLITSRIPHDPTAADALHQTRLFRGKIASLIALEHLYHLEHHLYPMVPHQNWPKLARRLDPYFKTAGLTPIVLGG
jgi:beta-carotene hydroxylase